MKIIRLKGTADVSLLRGFFFPALFGVMLCVNFLLTNEFEFSTGLLFVAFALLVIINRKASEDENVGNSYTVEFGKADVIFKNFTATMWHIPYHRVSHVMVERSKSSNWWIPKSQKTLIYTNDDDSYLIPFAVNEEEFSEISVAIRAVLVSRLADSHNDV